MSVRPLSPRTIRPPNSAPPTRPNCSLCLTPSLTNSSPPTPLSSPFPCTTSACPRLSKPGLITSPAPDGPFLSAPTARKVCSKAATPSSSSPAAVYSNGQMKAFDFTEPYLRAVLGFLITDVDVVHRALRAQSRERHRHRKSACCRGHAIKTTRGQPRINNHSQKPQPLRKYPL